MNEKPVNPFEMDLDAATEMSEEERIAEAIANDKTLGEIKAAEPPANAEQAKQEQKPEFPPEELARVFDQLMFEGVYIEKVQIKKGLSVVFRSRTVEETGDIDRRLEAMNLKSVASVQNQINVLNAAYSLMAYNGQDMKSMEVKDRYTFITKLPAAALMAISIALSRFDRKVAMSALDGVENF